MIVGVGIDLAEVDRIAAALARWGERFAARVFTPGERATCRARGDGAAHYAARFAAKEAAFKALGGPRGVSWLDLEVVPAPGGDRAPSLALHGAAVAAASALGVVRLHLSLTHTQGVAAAVVIAEGAVAHRPPVV